MTNDPVKQVMERHKFYRFQAVGFKRYARPSYRTVKFWAKDFAEATKAAQLWSENRQLDLVRLERTYSTYRWVSVAGFSETTTLAK